MEKLDEIMRAEEAARHALNDAKERARDIRGQAAAEAELIVSSGLRETGEKAAEVRGHILREADARAADEERDAEALLARTVQQAEGSFEGAVEAVVLSVRG